MTKTRVYVVADLGGKRHLVRAATPAAAIKHVADSMLSVNVASQDELIDLVQQGVPVESAGSDPIPVESTSVVSGEPA